MLNFIPVIQNIDLTGFLFFDNLFIASSTPKDVIRFCQLIIEDMLRKKIIKKDFTGKIGEKSSEQRKNKYEL